jgi:excisionase family DNA binding protein
LLKTSEVAAMFRVNPKVVSRWVREGKIVAIRPGGKECRFPLSYVLALLSGGAR